jgi:bacteriocin-like protein
MSNISFSEITSNELSLITGGAGNAAEIANIRQQAQQYCPNTAARYSNVDPAKLTRGQAQKMGNECVAEISPFLRGVARGRIDTAIDKAFPQH